jgi:hypothetical protein
MRNGPAARLDTPGPRSHGRRAGQRIAMRLRVGIVIRAAAWCLPPAEMALDIGCQEERQDLPGVGVSS